MSNKELKFFQVPMEEAQKPMSGECLVDQWWIVSRDGGLMFAGIERDRPAPQCNPSEDVTRRLQKSIHPDCDVTFVPVVYMARACRRQSQLRGQA